MNYKFLIYISYSYSLPIGNPLEKEIFKRGYTVKWFSNLEEGKRALSNKQNVLPTIEDVINFQPDIVLTITDSVPDFITGLKVQIFHGFPANKRKGTDQFTIRGLFDLYCTQGDSSTKKFKQLSEKHKTFEVIETGWSKVDALYPKKNREPSKIPTILIASTFTKQYSLALKNEVIFEIERLSKIGKWHFNIVLHPKLPESVKEKIKSIQNENLIYYDTTNLVPLFEKSDVLLADTTSAIIEYLLQEKPVVTLNNNMPGPYLIDINSTDQIENALEKALSRPEGLIKEIKKFANFSHAYTDGKSSKRVIDAAILTLHKDKSHLKPKPLNLLRKFKIRKQLKYFTLKSYNKPFRKLPSSLKKLTALVITYNERENIDALIENLRFADEIVIVDAFSSDGTVEAIKKHDNVKLVQHKFLNFSNQRNFALKQASYDWVLFIDADERISNDLKNEIIDTLENPENTVAYSFYRKFYFKDAEIKFSGFQTDNVFRLFNKNYVSYNNDKLVHETLDIDGETKVLVNKLDHYSYKSDNYYRMKLIKYAELRAEELYSKDLKPNFYHFYIKPAYRFLYQYIIRFGILDGKKGYKISKLNAFGVRQRYVELKKLHDSKEE